MASMHIDSVRGLKQLRAVLIPVVLGVFFVVFFFGVWFDSHKLAGAPEVERSSAIPYANLPWGRYSVDVVIDAAGGLVIVSRDQNVTPKISRRAVKYLVSAVPPNMCIPQRQFFVVSEDDPN